MKINLPTINSIWKNSAGISEVIIKINNKDIIYKLNGFNLIGCTNYFYNLCLQWKYSKI